MNLNQAKTICLDHIEFVLNGTKNNYTPTEIGEAIQLIAEKVNSKTLLDYNKWRRGEIEVYPNNSCYNMEVLKDCVFLC